MDNPRRALGDWIAVSLAGAGLATYIYFHWPMVTVTVAVVKRLLGP